jgi:hypothetical protein
MCHILVVIGNCRSPAGHGVLVTGGLSVSGNCSASCWLQSKASGHGGHIVLIVVHEKFVLMLGVSASKLYKAN